MRARPRFVMPIANNDRTRRSILTVRSPDSILATLDWLDSMSFASCACVKSLSLSKCTKARCQSKLELDESLLLVGEFDEISNASHLPACCLQAD